jgi:hypothetical protein
MASGKYAQGTEVTADRSRTEIERTLERFGASAFAYGWSSDRGTAQVMFEANGRRVRFELPMPDRSSKEFIYNGRGTQRTEPGIRAAYDAEVRRRWRALALVVKAKLEAVATSIVSFEEEFMAHIVLPSGETVGQWVGPQLEQVYGRGDMPALLPGAGDRR